MAGIELSAFITLAGVILLGSGLYTVFLACRLKNQDMGIFGGTACLLALLPALFTGQFALSIVTLACSTFLIGTQLLVEFLCRKKV